MFRNKERGDVEVTYANITKAKKLLGWFPKVNFEEGIEKQINWMKEVIKLRLI